MQTLKLIIPGSYYDSQIYSGRLYLWSNEGSIITLDWDRLIESVDVPDHLKLALCCAFQRSEYLYGDRWSLVFQDTEIKTILQRKFQELAEKPIEFSKEDLDRFTIRKQDNPFPFPHADCVIYSNTLYVGSQSGVFASRCNRKSKNPVDPNSTKLWDSPVLGMAASYLTLALSAGSEGVFEYSLDSNYSYHPYEARLLLKQHSNSVRWLYASIFSSSYFDEGYLADFILELEEERTGYGERRQYRRLREIVPSSVIFGDQTKNSAAKFAWGVHDKICLAIQGSIRVVQYNPYKGPEERFTSLGLVKIGKLQGDIVGADSALFGFLVEGEDGLLVINSLLESMWLEGEPVNWRAFPRSKFYTNQLHTIYEDHFCIHSFNQDYFVDQDTKRVGIRRRKEFPRTRYS